MRIRSPGRGDALLVVDVQKDFLPGGALAVPEGDAVIPPLNEALRAFSEAGLPIFATRDWHPPDHCSFVEQGGLWPLHCVAGTSGAAFPNSLRLPASAVLISKADDPAAEAYSAFSGTDLADRLSDRGVGRASSRAASRRTTACFEPYSTPARAVLDVVLLFDAVRAVNVESGDGAWAIDRMQAAGA